jgi:inner membrane protein
VPTSPSHAVAALAIGTAFYRPGTPKSLLALGALFAAIPDLDVIGFSLGVRYGDLLGHRELTHSLAFAAALAAFTVLLAYRRGAGPLGPWSVWAFLALAIASHGFLDAFTDGGLGIAFFAPFDTTRYFFPVRPIAVAPISIWGLLDPGIHRVVQAELLWVWAPSLALIAVLLASRGLSRAGPAVG